jgi:hypothetical protein
MGTGEVIGHIQQMDIENRHLREQLEAANGNRVDASKFYAVAVGVDMIATLHGVHPDTVRKYISLSLIEKHPDSTDSKMLVRGSVALLLDFSELRKQARVTAYHK